MKLNLKKDVVYFIQSKGFELITMGMGNSTTGNRICLKRNEYYPYRETTFRPDWIWDVREATVEEREWLMRCIDAGRLVERYIKPQINNSYELY